MRDFCPDAKNKRLGFCAICGKSVKLFVHGECGSNMPVRGNPKKTRKYNAANAAYLSGTATFDK